MFVAASFSLLSLLVFRPLVRGGEGAEKPSDSEFPSDLEEESREANTKPSWVGGSCSGIRTPFLVAGGAALGEASFPTWPMETFSGGTERPGGVSPCTGSSVAATAPFSWTSTSCNTSKLFLISIEGGVAAGAGSLC